MTGARKPRRWSAFALLNNEGEIQCVRFAEMAGSDHGKGLNDLGWTEITVAIVETCGCGFCDLGERPLKAEGVMWHKPYGADFVRCTNSTSN